MIQQGPRRANADPECGGLLLGRAADEGRIVVLDEEGGRLTRGELRAAAIAVASRLAAPRKRLVFLLASNDTPSLVALLGIAAAGHAVALIDSAIASPAFARILAAYRPDDVVSTAGVEGLGPLCPSDEGWSLESVGDGALAFARRETDGEINPSLFLLLSTSGTTGSQKFVRLSYSAVVANATQIVSSLGIDEKSVAIAHLPLHYSYGLSVVTSHFIGCGTVFLTKDAVTSPSFWTKVAEAGGTHFPGVPFHYTALARLGFGLVPASIDVFTQAGGALDIRFQRTAHDAATARGGRFFVMYGQTEAAPRIATLPHEDFSNKAGGVGRALPGGRLVAVNDEGAQLPAGESGAIVYEGPNVMMGYAESREDLARGDECGGRLETGDVGWIDSDGYLFLTGRLKRFAKIAGYRLGLDEIESAFSTVGVVACLDSGDKIYVCFDEEHLEPALKTRARDLATAYKIFPTSFALKKTAQIPRMGSGKVDYARLKETIGV